MKIFYIYICIYSIYVCVELGRVLMRLFFVGIVSFHMENLKEEFFRLLRQVIEIRYTIFLLSNHTALTLINNVHINCRE